MPFDTEILKDKIERIKQAYVNGQFSDALYQAVHNGEYLLKQRTFHENKDIEGNGFGNYIGKKSKARLLKSTNKTQNKRLKAIAGQDLTAYQRKRALAGAQINPKNLFLTGSLGAAIKTQIESEKAVVLEFEDNKMAKIAHGQEAQITNIRNGGKGSTKGKGVKIFGFNTTEKEQVVEQGLELINQILKSK